MPAMSTTWEKQALGRLIQDAVLQQCKAHQIYGGNVDVDGIICITGKSPGQELVIKIHERMGYESRLNLTDFLSRPRDGWTSLLHNSREDDAEDYSVKRQRLDESLQKSHEADSYPNLKQHLMTPSHARDLREIEDLRSRESAKDLSMSGSSGALDMTPPSPQGYSQTGSPTVSPTPDRINQSPHSPSFGGRYPYTSTPHSNFPRRIPIRSDRWSPGQPMPSVPECKPCGFTFNTFDILSDHNEAVHSVFTCQSCFKTFTSRSNLERHSRLHSGHRPYGCTICGKTFSRKDHLSNHATKHAFKCGTCSKRFTDKKMLVTHYSFDHNAILTNICDYCNKGFSSHEMYDEHLKAHPQCGGNGLGGASPKQDEEDMPQNLSMSSTTSLNTSLGQSPVKYVCKTCRFTTADKLTLLRHRMIHVENNRCYTCLSCHKMFEDPLKYSDHLLMHGSETNIFECCLCRQVCPTMTSLRRHEATHLTSDMDSLMDRPTSPATGTYGCPKCQKTFSSEYNLVEHMLLHNQSEGFVCSVCSEEFPNYSDICSHIEEEGHYAYQPVQNGTDGTSPKNKRKQKLPKAVKLMDVGEESDVEIVEPESPDDTPRDDLTTGGPAGFLTRTSTGEFLVTENPAPIIEITPEDPEAQPIKRILSQAIHSRKEKLEPMDTSYHAIETALGIHRGSPSPQKSSRGSDKASTSSKAGETNNNVMLSPKLMNVEIPAGPYSCSICSNVIQTFQELEMHCFSDHNRSPCMFCNKTFAQKANRDRHVCLHTGEKPYSCPDCNEKFSRGDKLKIHRMRAHQTSFPPVPPRGGGAGAGRDNSLSPSLSPSESQDSATPYILSSEQRDEWNATSDNMYSAGELVMAGGEWSVKDGPTPSGDEPATKPDQGQYVMAGGDWSVREEAEVTEGVDETTTASVDE